MKLEIGTIQQLVILVISRRLTLTCSFKSEISNYTNKNQYKMLFISILKTMKRRHRSLDLELKRELTE